MDKIDSYNYEYNRLYNNKEKDIFYNFFFGSSVFSILYIT